MKLLPIDKCVDCKHHIVKRYNPKYKFVCGHPEGGFEIIAPLDGIPKECPLENLMECGHPKSAVVYGGKTGAEGTCYCGICKSESEPQWNDNCLHMFKKED